MDRLYSKMTCSAIARHVHAWNRHCSVYQMFIDTQKNKLLSLAGSNNISIPLIHLFTSLYHSYIQDIFHINHHIVSTSDCTSPHLQIKPRRVASKAQLRSASQSQSLEGSLYMTEDGRFTGVTGVTGTCFGNLSIHHHSG